MITLIDCCASTSAIIPADAPHGYALMARYQTAGRGQRGNSWESEPGKNITLSLMIRPEGLPAARQFELSEAVALGVVDLLDDLGVADVAVKWPNDVYVGDRKICGILIENTVGSGGLIARAVAGIGLNVNQTVFRSSAPNPVSLRQLTSTDHPIEQLAERLVDNILRRVGRDCHSEYCARLWRSAGIWPWVTAEGETFEASITDILPDGRLLLSGRPEPFVFKAVRPAGFAN